LGILVEAVRLARDIVLALSDAASGRRRRRYEHYVKVRAPREIVWRMLRSSDLTFEGMFPIRITGGPVPGRPELERLRIEVSGRALDMLTRIVDERPGLAILYEILPEGTDPALLDGDDDYVGFVLEDAGDGRTQLGLTREMTVTSRFGRLTVPLGLRSGAQRYRRKAEAIAAGRSGVPGMEQF
jgi:hypothetical protein